MKTLQIPRRFVRSAWGGTETVILETSRRLIERGHETRIVCSRALTDRTSERLATIPIHRMAYFYPYLGLSRAAARQLDWKGGNAFPFELMRRLSREPGVDLLHLHTGKRFGGIARYVACRRNLPYVISLHGGVYDVPPQEAQTWTSPTSGAVEWGKALGWWVRSRHVLRDAAAILCVGAAEQRQVATRYPEKRVLHLPNGVDVARFGAGDRETFGRRHGIPLNAKVVLTVGRIDEQKNQLFALRLLPKLINHDRRVHLLLVGPDCCSSQAMKTRRCGCYANSWTAVASASCSPRPEPGRCNGSTAGNVSHHDSWGSTKPSSMNTPAAPGAVAPDHGAGVYPWQT